LNSSPYYAQANGQAEDSNKIMIKIIQNKIDQKPKRWHSVLNEALWAYRMAPHGATKTSPYELVYGHHAVLPWEMQSDSRRVVLQKDLSSKDYSGLMMDELEDLHMIRLKAPENIEKNKMRVAKYYMLGNSIKLVTLETLSLTKFLKHVFQEQGIRDCRDPGTCEALNS
jgi:hypothetical protein